MRRWIGVIWCDDFRNYCSLLSKVRGDSRNVGWAFKHPIMSESRSLARKSLMTLKIYKENRLCLFLSVHRKLGECIVLMLCKSNIYATPSIIMS